MTSVTLAPFPVARELCVVRRACRQLVDVQLPAAKGPGARRVVLEVGALWAGLFSAGVNAIPSSPSKGSSPRPPGQSPPSFSRHHQLRSLAVGAEGAGGVLRWWEPLPLPVLSASSPACPAVWPWFLSRLLPVLPLTDIVSMGIYISLTTLSPNGIKSKAGDK